MRVCLAYDCLFPWTVGGHERYMRDLAEAVAAAGHEVTFVTRNQWSGDDAPDIPGVRVVAVSPGGALYGEDGNRLIGPPLRFGRGFLGHLLRHRGGYDIVHVCSFPYFSLLAAGAVGTRPLFVDWPEVWSAGYWREYLGGTKGAVGWLVQRLCAMVPQHAFVFSDLHGDRLRAEGLRGRTIRLEGLYAGPTTPHEASLERAPLVVFAGRHIPEKRVTAIPEAIAIAARSIPGLEALILGDGPLRGEVLAAIDAAGVSDRVSAPGFVDADGLRAAIGSAAALLLPSQREGYGMIVIEAAASGTPSVVARGPDNAAVERITPGVNGVLAASDDPADLAAAIVEAVEGGEELRGRTVAWFEANAERLSVAESARRVLAAYAAV
ncbi:MAG: glycosyltransferase family 4 protein [Solirubrobacterales bacterium]|nr:glycosyltransferase family 4 protein [Solirubrobacterales bacterium]